MNINNIMQMEEKDHKLLAIWASDCAKHVLKYFEKYYPEDDRPRKAIEAARSWARGDLRIAAARKAALASHESARNAKNDSAKAAARAAGHAAATAHVADHARHAAQYAIKAVIAAQNNYNSTNKEIDWQNRRLPKHLRLVAFPNTLKSKNK